MCNCLVTTEVGSLHSAHATFILSVLDSFSYRSSGFYLACSAPGFLLGLVEHSIVLTKVLSMGLVVSSSSFYYFTRGVLTDRLITGYPRWLFILWAKREGDAA